ncbi:MAG: hypothetical protein LBU15_00230 [Rickettsiales bacterium]|jgi:hypothetical protein|nr:hypothetical protein [Rickettsiales bacterium]
MPSSIASSRTLERLESIDLPIFNYLLFRLNALGLDFDRKSFAEIRSRLEGGTAPLEPDEFAQECFYVICVAGFRQERAREMCNRVIEFISANGEFGEEDLLTVYGNRSKVKAIADVWHNRRDYQRKFYSLATAEEKVEFLGTLPHIGNITRHHLARNLGLNFVKYDIWIQRLGTALCGRAEDMARVNNSKLAPAIKEYCDKMFSALSETTGEKVGFIDVVLWRSCQMGLIKIKDSQAFLDRTV